MTNFHIGLYHIKENNTFIGNRSRDFQYYLGKKCAPNRANWVQKCKISLREWPLPLCNPRQRAMPPGPSPGWAAPLNPRRRSTTWPPFQRLDPLLWVSLSPLKKLSAALPPATGHVALVLPHSNVDDYICYILLTDLCARNIRWLKVQWTCKLAGCFSSKIERLPRGGGLESSTLPSKSNLFSPLDKSW